MKSRFWLWLLVYGLALLALVGVLRWRESHRVESPDQANTTVAFAPQTPYVGRMPITMPLKNFALSEFQRPELVDQRAADFLQLVRDLYGAPLRLTDDARTPQENETLAGAAPNSLHLKGQAFDLAPLPDVNALYKFTRAVLMAAEATGANVELGLYAGVKGHIHLGIRWDNEPNRLYTRLEG